MFNRRYYFYFITLLGIGFASCGNSAPADEPATTAAQTPVTVAPVRNDTMSEYLEVNATSVFLLKNFVKANTNGYLRSSNIHPGQQVSSGQVLFTITTKEAQSLGNAVNRLDSSFRFTGTNSIRAGGNGFITQLDHQTGDYVQDGEQLAVISDQSSFVFVMNAPYELHAIISGQKNVTVVLPDGEALKGNITSVLPQMDSLSQTERMTIKVTTGHSIPENLVAKVRMLKKEKPNAVTVPRSAILTDETQNEFWIMKMINDSTAVKIPVKKGMENADKVEILSPVFTPGERIVASGNYGLEDTARVKIVPSNK